MNVDRINKSLWLGIGLCCAAVAIVGCGTPRISADRQGIQSLGSIGSFTWRGRADYIPGGGLAGTIASLASDQPADKRAEIRDSGVYGAFEDEFVKSFSIVSKASVKPLDKSKYVLSGKEGEKRVDVVATARAEGFDAIIASTVWPTIFERAGMAYQPSIEVKQLRIEVQLQRVSDSKSLWQDAFTIEAAAHEGWKELARKAAKLTTDKYNLALRGN